MLDLSVNTEMLRDGFDRFGKDWDSRLEHCLDLQYLGVRDYN